MRNILRRSALLICLVINCSAAPRRYDSTGLVVAIDKPHLTVTLSHAAIPGYMEAMAMPFAVRGAKSLDVLHPGDHVAFTLTVDKAESWLENLHVVPFDSAERDPSLAGRLRLLDSVMQKAAPAAALTPGQAVPDFTLTDQTNHPLTLSKLRGKVVALNFVYTRCPLPDYCFRLSNNFGQLRKHFAGNPDLVLLTITFDPVHDQPDVLARYAQTWNADPSGWHFLTGAPADVERVCALFGVAHWQDDGLFTHSLHTAIIDRGGRLTANLEGNRFSARQLSDLVEITLRRAP